jgi:hypothetical protein
MKRLVIGPSVSVELKAPLRTGAGYVRWGNRDGLRIVDEVPAGAYFAANSLLHTTEVVLTVRLRPDVDRPAEGEVHSVKHAYVITRDSFDRVFPGAGLVSWDDAAHEEKKAAREAAKKA